MLFAIDLHKDFIDVECITIAMVLALQTASIDGSEFYAPQANRFATDGDTSLGKEIFNVTMAQIESVVEPDGITNDIGWGAPSRNRWRLYVFIRRFY